MTGPAAARRLLTRVDHDAVLELTERLIRTQGHQDLPTHERAVADLLAEELARRLPDDRSEVSLQAVDGDRANVTAVVRGGMPGPTLMLNAHLDTVPGYGMPDAYRPVVRDGRLYGRGAVDMKAALAAMLTCLDVLAAPDVAFHGELVLTAVAGEESGSAGMQALTGGRSPGAPTRADFAIVGEPTSMRVARAHKGAMWIEAEFEGIATHGSVPHEGVNAAYHAARFITAVEEQLVPRLSGRTHPVLGSATVSVGVVRGGDRPPMVPARCSVQLDRRWLPGERHDGVLEEVRGLVAELEQMDPRVTAVVREMEGTATFVHAPLECPEDHPGVVLLSEVVGEHLPGAGEPVGVDFWTDGALLAAGTGTPTVVCGPGDIAQAHSLDEWVSLDQVRAATDVYVDFAARYLRTEISGRSAHG
ncbi:M20 family metallopeptidase [Geodermatophilus sp. URMC 61]|uniref:M20 family metallopeptidase n=1 Tax=Geodermatophilus sp. URMC 61 TaxID=3423411 RepID=UPI00406C688C